MKRPEKTPHCALVHERSLAGERLTADQAAHALQCPSCQFELQLIRSLESAGRALRAERVPQAEHERALAQLALRRHPRLAPRLAWGATAIVVTVMAAALMFWPRAPSRAPAPQAAAAPAETTQSLGHLVEEVRAIRAEDTDDEIATPLEWQLPSRSGVVRWTAESTPVEALLPPAYGWLSEVLSSSTL